MKRKCRMQNAECRMGSSHDGFSTLGSRLPTWGLGLLAGALPLSVLAYSKTQAVERAKIPPLRPPLDYMPPTFWEEHGALGVAAIVVALGVLALAVWLLRRAKPVAVTPADALARQALEALRPRAEDESVVAAVSLHLRHYVTAAFLASQDELTTEELLTALGRQPQRPADLSAGLAALLRECDTREFAPISPPPPPALAARALDLVARLETLRQPPPLPTRSTSAAA